MTVPAKQRNKVSPEVSSWRNQSDKEGRAERNEKHDEINEPAEEKFKQAEEPPLAINAANGEKNLDGKSGPE